MVYFNNTKISIFSVIYNTGLALAVIVIRPVLLVPTSAAA